jgi:polar amino acid transport system substrate-binding protein
MLFALAGAAALIAAATACAPASDKSSSASASAGSSASCTKDSLSLYTKGQLTVGTDKPAYEPWFKNNDPSNGQGFESAVAYAVATKLGFAKTEVKWTTIPFDSSYAPGAKKFDFDVNQISITPDRAKVVTFSDGYYDVAQGVVTLKGSKYATISSISQLQNAKIAVQVGTTSLTAVQNQIKPSSQPRVFNDQVDAVNALKNKQVDAIVVDLPTAFYVTAAQVENSVIAGQLPATGNSAEKFGLLFQKGNSLVTCVNQALAQLKSSGELARIQQQWITSAGAPVLK